MFPGAWRAQPTLKCCLLGRESDQCLLRDVLRPWTEDAARHRRKRFASRTINSTISFRDITATIEGVFGLIST